MEKSQLDIQNDLQNDLFSVTESYAPEQKEAFVFVLEAEPYEVQDTNSKRRGIIQSELGDVFNDCDKKNAELLQAEKRRLNELARKKALEKLPYYAEPKNDNEKLLNFQYEYLSKPNQLTWWNLVELSEQVTRRIVIHFCRQKNIPFYFTNTNKRVPFGAVCVEDKAGEALEYVMRRYQDNIGYVVEKNYISFLKGGVKHAFEYIFTKKDSKTKIIDPTLLNAKLEKVQIKQWGM